MYIISAIFGNYLGEVVWLRAFSLHFKRKRGVHTQRSLLASGIKKSPREDLSEVPETQSVRTKGHLS